jgi:hypothetical protein
VLLRFLLSEVSVHAAQPFDHAAPPRLSYFVKSGFYGEHTSRVEEDMSLRTERDVAIADLRASNQLETLRYRNRSVVMRVWPVATTIFVAIFLSTSAVAQEQQRAYSEYTYWFGGSFENGHAFSSTIGARNYQLETRYERLIYAREAIACVGSSTRSR